MNRPLLPALLAILAFVALVILQFNVPWAHVRQGGGGGFFAENKVTTWQDQASGGFQGFTGGQTKGWYEGDWNDGQQSAVDKLRIAAPLLVGATVIVLVGALLAFVRPSMAAAAVNLLGALLAIGGTVLFSIASQDLLDGQQTWDAGFYVALVGCVLALVGGAFGLALGNRSSRLADA